MDLLYPLHLNDGILFRGPQICVPSLFRTEVLQSVHEQVGHKNARVLLRAVRAHFHWDTIVQDVHTFSEGCTRCKVMKRRTGKRPGHLHPFPLPTEKFTLISMDFANLPMTTRGHDQVLAVVDRATRYTTLIPCASTHTSKQVWRRLSNHVFHPFGYPAVQLQDNDPRFTSHAWLNRLKSAGIKPHFTTAYHPQTNGLSEAVVKRLKSSAKLLSGPTRWDLDLHRIQATLNNSLHSSLGFEPSRLLFGYCPRLVAGAPLFEVDGSWEEFFLRNEAMMQRAASQGSGFRFLVSGFRFPVSGFRLPSMVQRLHNPRELPNKVTIGYPRVERGPKVEMKKEDDAILGYRFDPGVSCCKCLSYTDIPQGLLAISV